MSEAEPPSAERIELARPAISPDERRRVASRTLDGPRSLPALPGVVAAVVAGGWYLTLGAAALFGVALAVTWLLAPPAYVVAAGVAVLAGVAAPGPAWAGIAAGLLVVLAGHGLRASHPFVLLAAFVVLAPALGAVTLAAATVYSVAVAGGVLALAALTLAYGLHRVSLVAVVYPSRWEGEP